MNVFATRLKKAREELKNKDPRWTQEFAAKKIGVARTSYTSYESGAKQPPLETVNKLADLFSVSTDYLLGRSNNPNSDISTFYSDGIGIEDEEEEEFVREQLEQFRKMRKRMQERLEKESKEQK